MRRVNRLDDWSPWHHQRLKTRNSRSGPVLSFLCSLCGSNCPKLIVRGFPFKENNFWIHLCFYVFWARKLRRINNFLPLKFKTQTVSPIQKLWTKNLEAICRVILTKTSQKIDLIVNLLIMVLISLPIIKFTCQHHVSGYVCLVWHLGFFSPIDWNNFCCKTFDHCTLFCIKTWQKHLATFTQNLNVIKTFWSNLFCGGTHVFCPNIENNLGLRAWCSRSYLVWIGLMIWMNASNISWFAFMFINWFPSNGVWLIV